MKSSSLATPLLAASLFILGAGLYGCQKTEPTAGKGPAEKAGQQLDQAAAKAGEQMNKVAEKAGQQLEKAGEKIKDAAKDAQAKTTSSGSEASKP